MRLAVLAAALLMAGPALAHEQEAALGAPAPDGRPGAAQPTTTGASQTEALHFAGGRIHQAIGFGNTYLVTTRAGDVVIDTSSVQTARRHRELLRAVSKAPVRYIVLTHAHGDHAGGVPFWREPGTKVVEQAASVEFRNYMTRLSGFYAHRNAAQFGLAPGRSGAEANPGNYAAPRLADVLFEHETTFKVGDLTFRVLATPGETPDHATVWIPELKAAFVGDNFYDSFPNLYTLRGTQQRKALDYVESIDKVLALNPEIMLPSHGRPVVGAAEVRRQLTKYRDAILYVHDATVRGMNEGKGVYELMRTIKLPPELDVGEGYGQIAWSVRGIYEGYAGWFDGDAATMYAVSPAEAEAELARLGGGAGPVAARARAILADGRPTLALRLTSAALAAEPGHRETLMVRKAALEALLTQSRNSNESGWLRAAIAQADAGLK
ncbi:MBL fold metallo-hydrolase [Phenylobacterium sp.]|uniref:MBL fold metallo-hydrolase n=1 Tax=Phenylobacterium sp. TaxID=1871053 RepID=UPI0025F8D9DA|nr:MBL fold metallo-hydrolase [Phenylobacterium sp.]MBX3485004.1 MBL fold metallo-hydrolase [Phenylobacterium sp.]MCW5759800.1 MBL fold metallo-hydrolase [Phenylobacterium sp.]